MIRVALTGGIGSGKSEVERLLSARGALVVDADQVAREVVEPGTPGLAAVAAEFGPSVLAADGSLDRSALAAVVFADPDARRRLEALLHPLIVRRAEQLLAAGPPDGVVVYSIALLAERAAAAEVAHDRVVVVDADDDVRVRRLVEQRGMPEADARARMAAQASRADRLALADDVLTNDGTVEELAAQVDALWERLSAAARAAPPTS